MRGDEGCRVGGGSGWGRELRLRCNGGRRCLQEVVADELDRGRGAADGGEGGGVEGNCGCDEGGGRGSCRGCASGREEEEEEEEEVDRRAGGDRRCGGRHGWQMEVRWAPEGRWRWRWQRDARLKSGMCFNQGPFWAVIGLLLTIYSSNYFFARV
jgi:hypothetical protein